MSKTLILYGPNDLRLEDQTMPEYGDNEVLVKIESVGVCGSDVTIWRNAGIGTFKNVRPLRLGHEPAGQIYAVGKNVTKFKIGDKVAIEPLISCKECSFCISGKGNLCQNQDYLGVINCDGALASFHVQHYTCCYKLPDSMTYDEGAMVQPLSIAVGICKRAKISFGQKVVVGGTGIIGTLCMMVAKACGTSKVCVVDISKERVDLAIKHGADCGVVIGQEEAPEQITQKIIAELEGKADVSLDCCGFSSNIESLMEATADGGVLTLVGIKNGLAKATSIVFKNLDVRGFFKTFNCYPESIDLIKNKKVDVASLISHRYHIDDYMMAFDNMLQCVGMKNIIYF